MYAFNETKPAFGAATETLNHIECMVLLIAE
jgi:hypothetical protein